MERPDGGDFYAIEVFKIEDGFLGCQIVSVDDGGHEENKVVGFDLLLQAGTSSNTLMAASRMVSGSPGPNGTVQVKLPNGSFPG